MAKVTGSASFSLSAKLEGSAVAGDAARFNALFNAVLAFEAGAGALDLADLLYAGTRQLAASANEDIDLAGILAQPVGGTFTAAEVMLLVIAPKAANAHNLNVTRPASNGFVGPFLAAGDGIVVKPGEPLIFMSRTGWAVTAGTGDLINIANAGAAIVNYDIFVIGRSVVG